MVRRFDDFVRITPEILHLIENDTKIQILTIDDFIKALDVSFQKAINEENIIAIKSCLAYYRILRFDDIPKIEAEKIFNKMFRAKENISGEDLKKLQDFMMHQVIQHAIKYDLPIQIHTGLQVGRNIITNSNPTHLINLFLKYRKAKFVIFHGSYPYMSELSAIAKNFSSVYIDMCWMHVISSSASKRYLEEW